MWGRHLLTYLPVNIAQAVVGFGAIYVLTRLLVPQDYGRYALALAASNFIQAPLFTWLDAAAARFYARAERRGRLADHFATLYASWAPIAAGSAVLFGLGLWLWPAPGEVKLLAGFTAATLILRAALKIFQETWRAEHDAVRYGLVETLHILAGFGLGIAFVLATPLRASGPFAGLMIAALICVVVAAPGMLKRAGGGRVDRRRVAAYANYGAPIAAWLVLSLIIGVSDRFMIAAFLDEAAAGVYSAGYALADRTLDIMFIWVGMAASPLAVALLEREGRDSARSGLRLYGETMILITLPAAAGLALVAGPLAAVMTGEAFRDQAAGIIPWIALASLCNGFTVYYLKQSFELARKTRLILAVMAAPAAANVALNLALLPVFGVTGAVIATVVAQFAGAVIMAVVGLRQFPLPLPWRALLRTAAACGVMAAAVLALPALETAWLEVLLRACVGGAVFALAALALDAGPTRAFAEAALRRLPRPHVVETSQ